MIDFSTFTLSNGLRVVHHYDASTSHVALNLLYNVGARDESPHLTGMAHLFEHLMFGGSVNVPDFDQALDVAGGMNNAWTSNDFTNFYEVVPRENVETAFWVESDRMLELAFSPRSLEVQRKVVMEEFKQVCINKPYGDTGHLLRGLLYKVHPYRYPTIGRDLADIERVTMDDVRSFYYTHYSPDNAVLAVTGPVTLGEVRELAQKWFGDIPKRIVAPRCYSPEPPVLEARRMEVVRDVPQTRITIAFPMDAYGTHAYRVADIITDILASGRSARFNRNLVLGTELFTAADASISGSEEPGFLMLNARLRDNGDHTVKAAEEALWQQVHELAADGVTDYELERALNRFESNRMFAHTNYLAKARELAMCTMHGENINDITSLYRTITADDIRSEASRLFQHSRSATLIYRSSH